MNMVDESKEREREREKGKRERERKEKGRGRERKKREGERKREGEKLFKLHVRVWLLPSVFSDLNSPKNRKRERGRERQKREGRNEGKVDFFCRNRRGEEIQLTWLLWVVHVKFESSESSDSLEKLLEREREKKRKVKNVCKSCVFKFKKWVKFWDWIYAWRKRKSGREREWEGENWSSSQIFPPLLFPSHFSVNPSWELFHHEQEVLKRNRERERGEWVWNWEKERKGDSCVSKAAEFFFIKIESRLFPLNHTNQHPPSSFSPFPFQHSCSNFLPPSYSLIMFSYSLTLIKFSYSLTKNVAIKIVKRKFPRLGMK